MSPEEAIEGSNASVLQPRKGSDTRMSQRWIRAPTINKFRSLPLRRLFATHCTLQDEWGRLGRCLLADAVAAIIEAANGNAQHK